LYQIVPVKVSFMFIVVSINHILRMAIFCSIVLKLFIIIELFFIMLLYLLLFLN